MRLVVPSRHAACQTPCAGTVPSDLLDHAQTCSKLTSCFVEGGFNRNLTPHAGWHKLTNSILGYSQR